MNPNRKVLALIVVLGLIGFVLAVYDFLARATGTPLWCPFAGTGCDTVQASPYALILGIPLSFLGILAFGIYVLLAGVALCPKEMLGKLSVESTYFGVWVLAALNLVDLASMAYFAYVQVALIHAICSLCVFAAALNVAIGIALLYMFATRRSGAGRDLR